MPNVERKKRHAVRKPVAKAIRPPDARPTAPRDRDREAAMLRRVVFEQGES